MATPTRPASPVRRRSPWFYAYLAACALGLLALMFLVGSRVSQTSDSPTVDDRLLAGTVAPVEGADGAASTNDFIPADRDITECISAIQKPGCGSEARGGWRQGLVLLGILAGLALIAWRVVVSSRRARQANASTPVNSAE